MHMDLDQTVGIREARSQWSSLLDDVEAGQRIGITRRGTLSAVLISVDEYNRLMELRERRNRIVFPHVTRVTVVGSHGLVYEKYDLYRDGAEAHLQDEGRTLKIIPRMAEEDLSDLFESYEPTPEDFDRPVPPQISRAVTALQLARSYEFVGRDHPLWGPWAERDETQRYPQCTGKTMKGKRCRDRDSRHPLHPHHADDGVFLLRGEYQQLLRARCYAHEDQA